MYYHPTGGQVHTYRYIDDADDEGIQSKNFVLYLRTYVTYRVCKIADSSDCVRGFILYLALVWVIHDLVRAKGEGYFLNHAVFRKVYSS